MCSVYKKELKNVRRHNSMRRAATTLLVDLMFMIHCSFSGYLGCVWLIGMGADGIGWYWIQFVDLAGFF